MSILQLVRAAIQDRSSALVELDNRQFSAVARRYSRELIGEKQLNVRWLPNRG